MQIKNLSLKNFQAYDYKTTNEILHNKFVSIKNTQQDEDKVLVLCIGVNGSGKSTYLANLYHNTSFNLPYLNADVLAQVLPKEERFCASKKATDMASRMIEKGQSFCFESVFTHPSKMELLKKAKQNGYNIIGIYVYADNCDINKRRVKDRVEQGGHYVPPEKIEERFNLMKKAVCGLIGYCNELYFYDNSKDMPLTIWASKIKMNEKVGNKFCQI